MRYNIAHLSFQRSHNYIGYLSADPIPDIVKDIYVAIVSCGPFLATLN